MPMSHVGGRRLKYLRTPCRTAASQLNVRQSKGDLIRGHALFYLPPDACWRRWASRCKWPNPHPVLQHQSPLITLLPHQPPPFTLGGTHNGQMMHTLQTQGGEVDPPPYLSCKIWGGDSPGSIWPFRSTPHQSRKCCLLVGMG